MTQTILQDIFLPPSRITISTLLQRYFLPSPLSNYETMALPIHDKEIQLGVHYLKYHYNHEHASQQVDSDPGTKRGLDVLYVNHGFGASSLSWLPALPKLVQRCKARVGLGHDAPGFGFTERPNDIEPYQLSSSATIGTQLIQQQSQDQQPAMRQAADRLTAPKAVALFGHSMGSITTLHMALQLPKETAKLIVLCSPALGLGPTGQRRNQEASSTLLPKKAKQILFRPISQFIARLVVNPIFGYILRRLVGYVRRCKE